MRAGLLALVLSVAACAEGTHAISLDAELRVDAGQLHFMTPAGSVAEVDPSTLVGKPYFAAVFPAAFAPGIDPPVHHTWGHLGDDLRVAWTTAADLADGHYDVVLVMYAVTVIPDTTFGTDTGGIPVAGDVATFTIEAKDPPLSAGQLRVTLAGDDAEIVTWNKWSLDTSAGTELFTDTLLLVP